MTTDPGARTTAGLLADALAQVNRLIRGEIALAKAEVARGLHGMARGLLMVLAAVVLGLVALNVLAGALVDALARAGLGHGWAGLLVGLGCLLIAAVLARLGSNALKPGRLAPQRAFWNLQRDAATLKEGMTHDPSH